MRVIPPITVTPAMLTSSSAVETTPAAYAGGTTYAADALVYVGTIGQALTVYKSLQSGNTGHAPASSPTWWKDMGQVYAEYDVAHTYAQGAVVQVAANHRVYESVTAGNVGNAVTDTAHWLDLGPTNRWKMFDLLRNTQTSTPDNLTVVIAPGARINSLALVGVAAGSVSISVSSVIGGGVIYDKTIDLVTRSVNGWYDYFFQPFMSRAATVAWDIPPHRDSIITLTLTPRNGSAACGGIVIGTFEFLGKAQCSAVSDALNFSTVTRDAFGNTELIPRRTVPTTNQDAILDVGYVPRVSGLRATLNAVPAFWSTVDDPAKDYFEPFLILGVYKAFSLSADEPTRAVVHLEIEEI